jgi:hypothetical protein
MIYANSENSLAILLGLLYNINNHAVVYDRLFNAHFQKAATENHHR